MPGATASSFSTSRTPGTAAAIRAAWTRTESFLRRDGDFPRRRAEACVQCAAYAADQIGVWIARRIFRGKCIRGQCKDRDSKQQQNAFHA
jgi:hypothetical protein